MKLTAEQVAEVEAGLARADRRLQAGLRAAHRTDAEQGEMENSFEGVGNAINMVAAAYQLARIGRRRWIGEGENATALRQVLAELRAAGIVGLPEAEDLVWVNTRRNTSAHEGAWLDVIDTEQVETAAGYGLAFLAGVRAWWLRQHSEEKPE